MQDNFKREDDFRQTERKGVEFTEGRMSMLVTGSCSNPLQKTSCEEKKQ